MTRLYSASETWFCGSEHGEKVDDEPISVWRLGLRLLMMLIIAVRLLVSLSQGFQLVFLFPW